MAFEQRELSGVLFKNEEKKTEKQPDYRGDAMIGGTKYQLSAWIKTGKKGKFMSLSFTPAREYSRDERQPPKDDSIPF